MAGVESRKGLQDKRLGALQWREATRISQIRVRVGRTHVALQQLLLFDQKGRQFLKTEWFFGATKGNVSIFKSNLLVRALEAPDLVGRQL